VGWLFGLVAYQAGGLVSCGLGLLRTDDLLWAGLRRAEGSGEKKKKKY
jgi:hypothetical protein